MPPWNTAVKFLGDVQPQRERPGGTAVRGIPRLGLGRLSAKARALPQRLPFLACKDGGSRGNPKDDGSQHRECDNLESENDACADSDAEDSNQDQDAAPGTKASSGNNFYQLWEPALVIGFC